MQRQVLLRRKNVVGLAVIINVERHVARHLARAEVSLHDESLIYSLAPGRCPPLLEVGLIEGVHHSQFLLSKLYWPRTGVGPLRVEELIGTLGTVGHSHAIAGGIVALSLQLQMEPHAELLRHLIIYDLRTLEDAAALNVVTALLSHAQCHSTVTPVHQVFRGVAHHADQRVARPVVLVLAEPVVGVAMFQDTAAVGVDMATAVVEP